jgi:hypothetical protein
MAFAALLGMFLFLTYYFQGNLGYSALKSGFAFLPFSAGIIGGAGLCRERLSGAGHRPASLATGTVPVTRQPSPDPGLRMP